jgi:hypothetical protein
MISDLLTRLEEEKDQWMYEAIGRFNERFDGRKYELTPGKTPEDQMIEIKDIEERMRKQKSLDLDRMENEIISIEECMEKDRQTLESLESTLDYLHKELEVYEGERKALDGIQLEKFSCYLDEKFNFDKKDQVIFKERKISKLMESYQMVEMEMLDFYQKQLSNIWLLLTRSMGNISSNTKFDFHTSPLLMSVSLNHGRGLDQYLKPGNFEEDYRIVLDTLERNNSIVYEYYVSQINQFITNCKDEMVQLWTMKNEHKRLADENVLELQEKKRKNAARLVELQDQLVWAKQEWEQDSLRPQLLEDILKEEFVKAVTCWQEKLFAENASDEERWAYHQYCQIILKQAERIMGNEYFEYN